MCFPVQFRSNEVCHEHGLRLVCFPVQFLWSLSWTRIETNVFPSPVPVESVMNTDWDKCVFWSSSCEVCHEHGLRLICFSVQFQWSLCHEHGLRLLLVPWWLLLHHDMTSLVHWVLSIKSHISNLICLVSTSWIVICSCPCPFTDAHVSFLH